MNETEGELDELIEELDMQHKILEATIAEQKSAKNTLAFAKLAGTFKERNDTYYVGVAISEDLIEFGKTREDSSNRSKKTHFDSYLVVVIILPKILQISFRENNFRLNVNVQLDKKNISKTVAVDVNNSIVIPWLGYPMNSEINIKFFGKMRGKNVVYRIPKKLLSFSYFLRPSQNEERKGKLKTSKEKLFQISKQYDQTNRIFSEPYILRCSMIVHDGFKLTDTSRNTCPNLLKSMFEHENSTKFGVIRNLSAEVELMMKNNLIQIESESEILWELKKFLVQEKHIHKELEVLAVREFSKKQEEMNKNNITDVIETYEFLRGIWNVKLN